MHTIIRILLETGGTPTLHIYKTVIQRTTQTSQAKPRVCITLSSKMPRLFAFDY